MQTTKTVRVIERTEGFEVRADFERKAFDRNLFKAYNKAREIANNRKIIIKTFAECEK